MKSLVEKYEDEYLKKITSTYAHIGEYNDVSNKFYSNKTLSVTLKEKMRIGCNGKVSSEDASNHWDYEKAIYVGFWYNCWGHLLTDALSKLWFVIDRRYDYLSEIPILYSTEGEDLPVQFYEILDILGIRYRMQRVIYPVSIHSCFLPDDSVFNCISSGYNDFKQYDLDKRGLIKFADGYVELINFIVENALLTDIEKYDKVFFSPGDDKRRIGVNEVARAFKKAGFIVYEPWKHSFVEQLSVAKSCKIFASIEGSVSFNSLFIGEDTLCILVRKLPYVDPYQMMINSIKNNEIVYVDTHLSLFVDSVIPYVGPFFLYINQNFENMMRELFGVCLHRGIRLMSFVKYCYYAFLSQNERLDFQTITSWVAPSFLFERLKRDFFDRYPRLFAILRKLIKYKK